MITYFKMKKKEWQMKCMFYDAILRFVENKKDIVELLQRLFVALKDVKTEDLRKELLSQVALLAHEQAVRERELEKKAK